MKIENMGYQITDLPSETVIAVRQRLDGREAIVDMTFASMTDTLTPDEADQLGDALCRAAALARGLS